VKKNLSILISAVVILSGILLFGIANLRVARAGEGDGDGILPPMCGIALIPIGIALYVSVSEKKPAKSNSQLIRPPEDFDQ
jgi:hypothetical protein